jgi:hypothetical protein
MKSSKTFSSKHLKNGIRVPSIRQQPFANH